MKYLRVFYAFLRPFKWQMAVFLAVTAISVVVESVRPYWLKLILDAAGAGQQAEIYLYFILFGVSLIAGNLISSLSNYLGDLVVFPFGRKIRETIFQQVLALDFAYHVNKTTGSLISAFKRGDGAVFDLFSNLHQELFRVVIYLCVSVYFLATLSLPMAVSLLVLFGANSVLIWWLVKINLKHRTDFNTSEDEVSGVITDSVINYETVKFFAAEEKEQDRLGEKFDVWTVKLWGFANSFRLMDVVIGTTSGLGMMWILWLAISKLGTEYTLGDLVMVAGFLTSFYYQFFNLFFRVRNIAKNMTDLEKYFAILDQEVLVKDPKASAVPHEVTGRIDFENVTFDYPAGQKKALDRVSLTIEAGRQVAFVGRSGSGKTTVVKLLLRFYDPSIGTIKLDGVDIKDMAKSQLRSFMGVVPQEPIMFNNTLKYNLGYGKTGASQEEMTDAAKKANILDFIEGLPEKWDTQVGERGIKLSGGQKQRLAIARALLTNPKVLIFDEATSNLDSESERMIQKSLTEVAKKRTVIIIAHRFSTIRNADKIVVLSDGQVVEEGVHKQLLAAKGIYAMLWSLQAKGKAVEV